MIFVIIVLGIVVGGTFIQISSIYEEMLRKEHSNELQTEAKVVVEEVTSRLSNSIKDSLVAMTNLDGSGCTPVSGSLDPNTNYILAWVGRSDEANLGLWDTAVNDYRGWSGFVDVEASTATSIITNGSKLDYAETIIDDLTNSTGSLSTNPNSAIYFIGSGSNTNACSDFFTQTGKMYQVTRSGETQLNIIGANTPSTISEQYTLSHSAYAIAREGNDLYLYSFRPWSNGEKASDGKKYLLAKNVSGFGFKWEGGLFRVNICVKRTLNGFDIEVCKEKGVF